MDFSSFFHVFVHSRINSFGYIYCQFIIIYYQYRHIHIIARSRSDSLNSYSVRRNAEELNGIKSILNDIAQL